MGFQLFRRHDITTLTYRRLASAAMALSVLAPLVVSHPVNAATGDIHTLAGGPTQSPMPATGIGISLRSVLAAGANFYLSETTVQLPQSTGGGTVRSVDPSGNASLVAGRYGGDYSGQHVGDSGPANLAMMFSPAGMAADATGDLYITETGFNNIRKIDPTGTIDRFAGNLSGGSGFLDNRAALSARLNSPQDVAVDASGNVYIADTGNQRIRKVDTSLNITTVAGNGTAGFFGDGGAATSAFLNAPRGVAVDSSGNLIISDTGNQRLRRVDHTTQVITTVAGTGTAGYNGDGIAATAAQLNNPYHVSLDSTGDMFISDSGNNRIREVVAGTVSTVAGTGTTGYNGDSIAATTAQLSGPTGTSIDGSGNLLIADSGNQLVRRVTGGTIATVAGNRNVAANGDGGRAANVALGDIRELTVDARGDIFIWGYLQARIRRIDHATNIMTTFAGGGSGGDGDPAISASINGNTFSGLSVDAAGTTMYFADVNCSLRKVDAAGILHTVAGNETCGSSSGDNGPAGAATFSSLVAVAQDPTGNVLVGDGGRVRRIDAFTGVITTVAGGGGSNPGDSGPATSAVLGSVDGLAFDRHGNYYISDGTNDRVRKASTSGTITTVAGTGVCCSSNGDGELATSAQVHPWGVAVDAAGALYITESAPTVRRVDPVTGIINAVAGTGISGYGGEGPALTSQIDGAFGVAVDGSTGNVDFMDYRTWRVRSILGVAARASEAGGDFDADGRTDLTVYRPSSGTWYTQNSGGSPPYTATGWGTSTDIAVPADYDGTGRSQRAVFRPSTGTWFVLHADGSYTATVWGASSDIPVPGDYSGTGGAQVAVYRPSTGTWFVQHADGSYTATVWGASSDIPVPADYDSAGRSQVAVYRPSTGTWFIRHADASYATTVWGASSDIPVPGDYSGTGGAQVAVYRPSTGTWFVLHADASYSATTWGGATSDQPEPGDYDGDGKTDIAVYRPSTGTWFVLPSGGGGYTATGWGTGGDVPTVRPAFVAGAGG